VLLVGRARLTFLEWKETSSSIFYDSNQTKSESTIVIKKRIKP